MVGTTTGVSLEGRRRAVKREMTAGPSLSVEGGAPMPASGSTSGLVLDVPGHLGGNRQVLSLFRPVSVMGRRTECREGRSGRRGPQKVALARSRQGVFSSGAVGQIPNNKAASARLSPGCLSSPGSVPSGPCSGGHLTSRSLAARRACQSHAEGAPRLPVTRDNPESADYSRTDILRGLASSLSVHPL